MERQRGKQTQVGYEGVSQYAPTGYHVFCILHQTERNFIGADLAIVKRRGSETAEMWPVCRHEKEPNHVLFVRWSPQSCSLFDLYFISHNAASYT